MPRYATGQQVFTKRQSGIVLTREPQTRELFTLAFTFFPQTGNKKKSLKYKNKIKLIKI
jgi:hypothetical protein